MSLKRRIIFLVVAFALAASAAGAYAATQTSKATPRQAFFNDVARRLHVTPMQLKRAVDGAFADRLSALVAAGRITPAEARAIEKRLRNARGVPGARALYPGMFFPGVVAPGPRLKALRAGKAMPPGWYAYPPPPVAGVVPGSKLAPGSKVAPGRFGPQVVPVPGAPGVPPGVIVPRGPAAPPGVPMPPGVQIPRAVPLPPGVQIPRAVPVPVPPGVMMAPGAPGPPGLFGLDFGPGLFGSGIRAATSYLGVSFAKLQSELSSGKSLAEIASAAGKTKAGLESAIKSAVNSRVETQAAANHLPAGQAKALLGLIDARVAAIVTASPPRVAWRVYKFRARQRFRLFGAPAQKLRHG